MQSGEASMSQGDFPEGDGISREHWDLNIPPELWGRSALDEAVELEPPSVDIAVKQQGVCDEKMVSAEPCPSTVGDADHEDELLDSSIGLKIVLDHGEEKEYLPVSCVDGSSQEDCQLECTPIDIAEDEGRPSPAGGTPGPETGSSLVNAYPVCAQSLGHVSELEVVPDENKDAVSVAELDGGCHLIEVETKGKNNVDMCTESEFGKMDQSAMFSHHAEEGSSVLLERNSFCQAEVSHIDALDIGGCGPDDNSKPEISSVWPGSRRSTYQGSSDIVELSPESASAAGHVPLTMDMKMKNNKNSVMADENSNSAKFDASQYEEGEFRETDVRNNWGGDETEDEEECVDYGSDTGEMGVEAADNVECKNMELSEVGYARSYAPLAGGDRQDIRSRLYLQDQSVSVIQDTGCGNRRAGRVTKDCDGTKRCVEFPEGSNSACELMYSTSLDLKSSGLDRLSEGCTGFGDGTVDSDIHPADKYQTTATYTVSNVGESSRRKTVTASDKYLSSRIERPIVKASRSSEASEPDFRSGAFRKCRPSWRTDNTGRDDYWVDSRNHQVPESRDSTGYYDTCIATRPGPKNAVASVTAKLESKGFFVASDRTIFRAGSSRHPSREVSQSANDSSQRTCPSVRRRPPVERGGMQRGLENRELIPDRFTNISWCKNDRDSTKASRTGYTEKYRANGPKHEPLYIREQSFSPQRRYPSTSRTRSPMWTTPRESRDHVINRKTGKRRRSGSPYYKSQVMGERMRSQMRETSMSFHQRRDYKYIEDVPSARNQKPPLHASRWPDEGNESPNRFRKHRYRRYSHTREDGRGISQDHRFEPIEPPEFRRTDCYYCPVQAGRFPVSTDVSRGPRHHSSGNHRSRLGNGRDVLHFMRERDI